MKTVTVEDVHREFFTASEAMVESFRTIDRDQFINKVERLQKLGFVQCADMKRRVDYDRYEWTKQLIDEYAISHPNNKVISKNDVITICEKYGLLLGELWRYTGFVPEKNLKEIEQFYHKTQNEWLVSYREYGLERKDGPYYTELAAREIADKLTLKAQRILSEERGSVYSIRSWTSGAPESITVQKAHQFYIAAPRDKMQINVSDTIEGVEIKKAVVHVPDPIVLYPIVEDQFYLIATAWGDEASDPLVVNERFN